MEDREKHGRSFWPDHGENQLSKVMLGDVPPMLTYKLMLVSVN